MATVAPILVALDSARADDKFLDVLRIDTAGTGKFADAPSTVQVAGRRRHGLRHDRPPRPDNRSRRPQGPRPGPRLIAGNTTGPVALYLMFGSCLEGQCAFGDAVRTVRSSSPPATSGWTTPGRSWPRTADDGFLPGEIGWLKGDPQICRRRASAVPPGGRVGQPLLVGGKWYDLAVSADGNQGVGRPAKGPFGKIKFDADRWEAQLISADHVFPVSGGKDPVEVPAGKYAVRRAASIRRTGERWS